MSKRTFKGSVRSLILAGLAGIISSGCVSSPRQEIAEPSSQGKALQRRVFDAVPVTQPDEDQVQSAVKNYRRVEGLDDLLFPVYTSSGVQVPIDKLREFCAKMPDSLEKQVKGVYFCTPEDFDNTLNQFAQEERLKPTPPAAYALGSRIFFKTDKFTLTYFAHEASHALVSPQRLTKTNEWLQISELSLVDYTEKFKETTPVPGFGVVWNNNALAQGMAEDSSALQKRFRDLEQRSEINNRERAELISLQESHSNRVRDYDAAVVKLDKDREELERLVAPILGRVSPALEKRVREFNERLEANNREREAIIRDVARAEAYNLAATNLLKEGQELIGPRGQFPIPYSTVNPDEHMAVLTELIIARPEEAARFMYQADAKTRAIVERQVTYLYKNGALDDNALQGLNIHLQKLSK